MVVEVVFALQPHQKGGHGFRGGCRIYEGGIWTFCGVLFMLVFMDFSCGDILINLSFDRYFGPHLAHERVPIDDESSLMESAHLIPPNNIPLVPPSTPVSTVPGYSSDCPDGRSSPIEPSTLSTDGQEGASSGAPRDAEGSTLVRPASFQRIVQALGSMRPNGRGSSDAEDDGCMTGKLSRGSGEVTTLCLPQEKENRSIDIMTCPYV